MLKSLYTVDASVLPGKVLMLLSRYQMALKESDNIIIELSSIHVFKHVHNSYARSKNTSIGQHYRNLLKEVSAQIEQGNMTLCTKENSKSIAKPIYFSDEQSKFSIGF